MEMLRAGGIEITPENLKISDRAVITMPYNVMQDCLDIRNGLTRFYTDKLRPARVDNSSIMRPYYVRVNGMDRWLQTRIDKMLDCGIITTPVAVSEIHAWARERKLTETGGFLASLR